MLLLNRTCFPEEFDMNGHCLAISERWNLNDHQYRFVPTNAMNTEYIIKKLQRFELKNKLV